MSFFFFGQTSKNLPENSTNFALDIDRKHYSFKLKLNFSWNLNQTHRNFSFFFGFGEGGKALNLKFITVDDSQNSSQCTWMRIKNHTREKTRRKLISLCRLRLVNRYGRQVCRQNLSFKSKIINIKLFEQFWVKLLKLSSVSILWF